MDVSFSCSLHSAVISCIFSLSSPHRLVFFVIFINNDAMGILEGFPHPFKETSFHHGPDGDDDYFSPEVALST